jgi:hypothetical protein
MVPVVAAFWRMLPGRVANNPTRGVGILILGKIRLLEQSKHSVLASEEISATLSRFCLTKKLLSHRFAKCLIPKLHAHCIDFLRVCTRDVA